MTTSNHDHDHESADINDAFADLVSSMPDLAALNPDDTPSPVEIVEIAVPDPNGSGESARITLEVPAGIAPLLRAEFSPERIAAMTQAITAMTTLMNSPDGPPRRDGRS